MDHPRPRAPRARSGRRGSPPRPDHRPGRRGVLFVAVAAPLLGPLITGCDPTTEPGPEGSTRGQGGLAPGASGAGASATPHSGADVPLLAAAVADELGLLRQAEALVTDRSLERAGRGAVARLAEVHRAHVALLAPDAVADRPLSGQGVRARLGGLTRAEGEAARAHLRRASSAQAGSLARVFGVLAAASLQQQSVLAGLQVRR